MPAENVDSDSSTTSPTISITSTGTYLAITNPVLKTKYFNIRFFPCPFL